MNSNKVVVPGSERQPVGKRVGAQPSDETIEVSIILKPKSRAAGIEKGGAHVSREEFAAKHGADSAAIEQVKQFAKENQLTVSEISPERRTVKLEGTAANMMKAFEVQLERYEHENHQYRARTGGIKLPPEIAPSVEAVLGLDDRPQAKTHFRLHGEKPHGKATPKAAPAVSYTPRQVARLYQFPPDADGTGQTVGILEFGGGFHAADLKTYFLLWDSSSQRSPLSRWTKRKANPQIRTARTVKCCSTSKWWERWRPERRSWFTSRPTQGRDFRMRSPRRFTIP